MAQKHEDNEEREEEFRAPIKAVRVDTVKKETLEWLWEGRLPLGKFTLLDGDPSVGKSTMICDIVARITTGTAMEGEEKKREPASVLMVCVEDGVADTIRPRLEAAGADAAKVYVLDAANRPLVLPDDIEQLKAEVNRIGAKLVVIDPIVAVLGSAPSSDANVREALQPLVNMAAETKATVLGIRHLTKSGGKNVIYRGTGSISIMGLARAALLLARDPDDANLRVLSVSKCNLSARAQSLQFRFEETKTGFARIEWLGTSPHALERLLATAGDPEKRAALDEAVEVLRDMLAAGPLAVKEVQRRSAEAGVAWATMRRAQARLRVSAEKVGFGGLSMWLWRLPASETHDLPETGNGTQAAPAEPKAAA